MLNLDDLQRMQKTLQGKHRDDWPALTPEYGRSCLLWMTEEFGEAVSVVKKCGDRRIMEDAAVRAAFVEELADVMMFLNDTLLCYGVTPGEFSDAYEAKYLRNLQRDWSKEPGPVPRDGGRRTHGE